MEVDPDAEKLPRPNLRPEHDAESAEERCRRYGQEAHMAMARGKRPFIHLEIRASQSQWGCPEVMMEYMPYAGDSYQVPIPGERWSGCIQSPISDLPETVTNERDGVAWTMKHLIGVVWFRLGNYEEALACFARVPRSHEFRPATDECIQRSKALAVRRETLPAPGPP